MCTGWRGRKFRTPDLSRLPGHLQRRRFMHWIAGVEQFREPKAILFCSKRGPGGLHRFVGSKRPDQAKENGEVFSRNTATKREEGMRGFLPLPIFILILFYPNCIPIANPFAWKDPAKTHTPGKADGAGPIPQPNLSSSCSSNLPGKPDVTSGWERDGVDLSGTQRLIVSGNSDFPLQVSPGTF